MYSMTGYGRAQVNGISGEWIVECSSVNRKHLEIATQLPKELLTHEPLIRTEVANRIRRGRIQIIISRPVNSMENLPRFRQDAALQAYKELEAFRKAAGLKDAVNLQALLLHPAVFAPPETNISSERLWEEILPALHNALDSLVAMRAHEGRSIAIELNRLIEELSVQCRAMALLAPEVPKRHRQVLLERIAAANLPTQILDETRIAMEIALFADRCDITEELARLESHIAQFREKMQQPATSG
ncbi:MAG: DUF1732 domain-containing protein, partial [Chthoniobacterales bacterium]|nr:DUF1732 domain-containing protein [Chthoniobacterales bacterium]